MRSHARISLGLAVLLALSLRPGATLAIEHPSTRISSLGGDHVAGVIPDLYTDLTINPAYAFFADRPAVSYAKRSIPGYAPSLPYLLMDSGSYGSSSMMVNELSAWGIRLSSWRTAVFAQWALYRPENSSSDLVINPRYNESNLREAWSSGDDDFARIDLIAARALGDRYALGLRLQGWGYYDSSSQMNTWANNRYNDLSFSTIDYQDRNTEGRSSCGRRLSFDFQAGIVKSNDAGPRTDLALKVSLNRLDYQKQRYELDVTKYYDSGGLLDSYTYYRYRWNDARKGDLWDFALTLRHAFDGGIRVLAGGGISTCSYETDWSNLQERVRWDGSSSRDEAVSGSFDGDGSLFGGNCFFKGGKIFSLHETTDLYLGLHGILARIHTEEEPLVHYTSRPDGAESAVRIDRPTRLESAETSFELYVPLSVEFRPSSYFTFFSSFILIGRWDKQTTTKPMPSSFYYSPPAAKSPAGGANRTGTSSQIVIEPEAYSTDWNRDLYTGSAVTLGFSLHYRDRFFMDVYTGAEIIPAYLTDQMIDIRYVF